ncbi:MAG TPA: hypothetical protein VNH18_32600 [Bryobacteraceae bacterium]|nr:hypothetical protein [Bryobacteraceae bacterium]
MKKSPKDPFAVDWNTADIGEVAFTQWLCVEIQNAIDARASWVAEGGWIDLFHLIYDQDQMDRQGPWPNSANLTSWIGTVQVDSMGARIQQAICGVEPLCTARGWGADPIQTAKVEAVMEWQANDSFLRDDIEDAIELALIEGTSMLEVDERPIMRHARREITVAQQTTPTGEPLFDEQAQPLLQQGADGNYQEWSGDTSQPSVNVFIEERNYACGGSQRRVLGGKDFLILPGHARNDSEVWGYAKRIYLRPIELHQRAEAGTYTNIDRLDLQTSDRQQRAEETRRGITIEPQQDQTVQKELWEVHLCYDIDGDGADEWLIATISIPNQVNLRTEYDQLKQMRGVFFRPFPNPTWVYGRSLIQKLITTIFEHTAERNMIADRGAMAVSAPLQRLTTAYWNPFDQPMGPQAVIDVRSHDEVKQMQIADVPQSMVYMKRDTESAAERIGGVNDSAIVGASPEGQPPTATQVQTTTQAAYIRVDKATRRLRNAVSKVYDLEFTILKRQIAGKGEQGMSVPDDVIRGMTSRGVPVPQGGDPFAVTVADLAGRWTFKPKGSVQSSDKRYLLQNFNGLMSTLAGLAKMNPQLAQNLSSNPEIVKEFLSMALYIYDAPDPQKILDTLTSAPAGMPSSPMGPGQPPMAGTSAPVGLPPQLAQLLHSMSGPTAPPNVPAQPMSPVHG